MDEKIKLVLEQNKIKYSSIITQRKGSAVTANISIELDKGVTVDEATKVTEKLKGDLLSKIDEMEFVVIQIKSQEESYNYFRSKDLFADRKVVAWRGRKKESAGQGAGGFCVCDICGERVKHAAGVPCSQMKCSKCGGGMRRE